tara:strand:+ start:851 stop:1543 length:693 start_codon:yes stop_codon:yes gene_type:complete
MEKNCIIRQPAGLGDIFYTQKIAKKILSENKANIVIWPVIDNFIYLKDYLIDENIKYVKLSDFVKPINSFEVQLDGIHEYLNTTTIMLAKYESVGLDPSDWANYFKFERNIKREERLYNKLITPEIEGEGYILRSEYYGSPPKPARYNLPYEGKFNIIDIKFYENVNIFDWCKIIENASEIHMVDTCFIYICEKLNLKSKSNFLYSRFKPANFSHIKHIPRNTHWKYKQW